MRRNASGGLVRTYQSPMITSIGSLGWFAASIAIACRRSVAAPEQPGRYYQWPLLLDKSIIDRPAIRSGRSREGAMAGCDEEAVQIRGLEMTEWTIVSPTKNLHVESRRRFLSTPRSALDAAVVPSLSSANDPRPSAAGRALLCGEQAEACPGRRIVHVCTFCFACVRTNSWKREPTHYSIEIATERTKWGGIT